MTDPWTTWPEDSAARATEEARTNERQREAIAELLATRGHHKAAAIVAIAEFQCVQVDGWDGGQYEAYLSVPAAQYDHVSVEVKERIDDAAGAVIGRTHYRGLNVDVALGSAPDGWAQNLLQRLHDQQEPRRASPLALPAATASDQE